MFYLNHNLQTKNVFCFLKYKHALGCDVTFIYRNGLRTINSYFVECCVIGGVCSGYAESLVLPGQIKMTYLLLKHFLIHNTCNPRLIFSN